VALQGKNHPLVWPFYFSCFLDSCLKTLNLISFFFKVQMGHTFSSNQDGDKSIYLSYPCNEIITISKRFCQSLETCGSFGKQKATSNTPKH
jgi:hypothetical protein